MTQHLSDPSTSTARSFRGRIRFSWGVFWICAVAALIGAYEAWLVIDQPLLGSDSGMRVFNANLPVVKIGNRVWLPFLQGHIWLYHLLGLPFAGLKLITVFYFALGTACLGLYWRRILGNGISSAALAIIATVCFAGHRLSVGTGELMQEPLGAALFFAFLLIATMGWGGSLVGIAVGAAAMLTRDAYWFYLFAVTLIAARYSQWNFHRVRSYVALWAVPVLWLGVCIPALYLIVFGRLPTIPIEWPLMYNPVRPSADAMSSADSLWLALVRSRVLPVAGGVAVAGLALAVWRGKRFLDLFESSEFTRTAIRATPIALAVVYGLILLVNPWQVTPGNPRAAWPLLEISFAVAPLLIVAARSAPGFVRLIVPLAVVGGLVAGVHPEVIRSREESDTLIQGEHEKLRQIISATEGDTGICIMGGEVWAAYRELNAPLFLERKTWVPWGRDVPRHCKLLIFEDGAGFSAPDWFEWEDTISVRERGWQIYQSQKP